MTANLPIGGFFPEETISQESSLNYHQGSIALKSGRSCFNLILKSLKPKKVYLPFYICDVMLVPLTENGTQYEYYSIDQNLDPLFSKPLLEGEYFVYVNYFGIKSDTVAHLYRRFQLNLIVDNTQAFFEKSLSYLNFNTCRKFFGVSDGAFLYSPSSLTMGTEFISHSNNEINNEHLIDLKEGRREVAFKKYQEAEIRFDTKIEAISDYSFDLINGIDMNWVKVKRQENFSVLHKGLSKFNALSIDVGESVPFCYPFLSLKKINRLDLIKMKIFFPILWPNVNEGGVADFSVEKNLAECCFPLPIDHRYGASEMNFIVEQIQKQIDL